MILMVFSMCSNTCCNNSLEKAHDINGVLYV